MVTAVNGNVVAGQVAGLPRAQVSDRRGDLSRIAGVADVTLEGHTLRAQVDDDGLGELIKALGDAGVRSLVSQTPTLEDLFLRHYGVDHPVEPVTA